MTRTKKLLLLILLFQASFVTSQNRILEKDSIVFERYIYNASLRLILYEKGNFEFQLIVPRTVVTITDENGNEITQGPKEDTVKYTGTFKAEKDKLRLSYDKELIFMGTEYYVWQTHNKTHLISKEDLKCIKEWKDESKESVLEYMTKNPDVFICGPFASNDTFVRSFDTKYLEQKFKRQ